MRAYPLSGALLRTPGRITIYLLTAVALVLCFSCRKPVAQTPIPTAPTASGVSDKPTVNYFDAEPTVVAMGQSSSLRWSIGNATNVHIDPEIGEVKPNDHLAISPAKTTTYTLTASNAVGNVEVSVTVTVHRPPVARAEPEKGESGVNVVNEQLRDVHFDYNDGNVKDEERSVLEADAALLQNLFQLDPAARVTVEGHCDERGSDEYNFALGDRRAGTVKDALVRLGVPAEKLDIVSYGKERPLCTTATEECFARNRRAHFSAAHGARARSGSALP